MLASWQALGTKAVLAVADAGALSEARQPSPLSS